MYNNKKKYDENIQRLLKQVLEHFQEEDREVRERNIRQVRRLKLMWEGFVNTWYSEVAHDWRIWDAEIAAESGTNQSYYDKPVNVFRAYLESIIAALSVTVPPVTCYPDDADNPLDLVTAKAGDKIASLIYRHNEVTLLWVHALFIYCTEGMVSSYHYVDTSKEYGEYEEKIYEDISTPKQMTVCPNCGYSFDEADEQPMPDDTFLPELEQSGMIPPATPEVPPMPEMGMGMEGMGMTGGMESCPACGQLITPEVREEVETETVVVDTKKHPKSRVKIEAYGSLNVKTPVYARRQSEMPYLIYSYETHWANLIEKYPHLKDNFPKEKATGAWDQYEQWGRLPYQYMGDPPDNNVTHRQAWFRPAAFNILNEDEAKLLKKEFPDGVKLCMVNDEYADAYPDKLDDCWTITHNPLADYIHHEPLGLLLVSIQEITNDIISLTLQTMEHGITQTFVDPAVVNFNQYQQTEVVPGGIYPATPKSGKSLSESFHEVKTATLSPEVMPFASNMQSMAQLVSGALPSLFGGQMENTQTASEYSMSRSQALQRLQNTWKMLIIWWKNIFTKSIPKYIDTMDDDERWVEKDQHGGFLNMFIRRAETEGTIGRVEVESNENLPMNWQQQRDIVMELLKAANPELLAIIAHPDNLPFIRRALGLVDLYVPGEDERTAEYEEINELVNSEPIVMPNMDPMTGMMTEQEQPSVEIDVDIDNHAIRFEIDKKWLISDVGRQTKIDNPSGYRNVLLHALAHKNAMQMQMMEQQMQQLQLQAGGGNGSAPPAKPNENEAFNAEPPITGESDVTTVQ